jgi:hypothetical protein
LREEKISLTADGADFTDETRALNFPIREIRIIRG